MRTMKRTRIQRIVIDSTRVEPVSRRLYLSDTLLDVIGFDRTRPASYRDIRNHARMIEDNVHTVTIQLL